MSSENGKVCCACGKGIKIDEIFNIDVSNLGVVFTRVDCYRHYVQGSHNEDNGVLQTLGIIDQL